MSFTNLVNKAKKSVKSTKHNASKKNFKHTAGKVFHSHGLSTKAIARLEAKKNWELNPNK